MSLTQLDEGNLYDNYSDFEACKAFLVGDDNISGEMWTTDLNTCQERGPEVKRRQLSQHNSAAMVCPTCQPKSSVLLGPTNQNPANTIQLGIASAR